MEVDLPSSQLAVPSIGVREATDLIRMVWSGRVGWGGGGGGGGGGSQRLALCQCPQVATGKKYVAIAYSQSKYQK